MKNLDLKDIYLWPISAQMVLLSLLSFMLIYFGYLLDISLLQKQTASVLQQENQNKMQIKAVIDKHAELENEIEQIPQLKANLDQWRRQVVSSAQIPDLQDRILKFGNDDHLHFNHYDPGMEIKDGDYMK